MAALRIAKGPQALLLPAALPVGGRSVERIRIPAGELMLRDASRADTVDFHVYVSSLNNLEYKDGGVSARGHYTLYAPEYKQSETERRL